MAAKKQANRAPREGAKDKDSDRIDTKKRMEQLYAQTFGTKAGAEVLTHLCKTFHVLSPAFMSAPDGSCDPYAAASRDGSKYAVQHILKQIAKGKKEKTVTIEIP